MKADDAFISLAVDMVEWTDMICDQLGFTLHRFADNEWWALWHQPTHKSLGIRMRCEAQLRAFLRGESVGSNITLGQINFSSPD